MAFFQEFKRLSKCLDSEIQELSKDILTKTDTNELNHAAATNMLCQSVKEARDLKSSIENVTDDFVRKNVTFADSFNLFKKVLDNHKSRLANVEDHMEKYGFKKLPEPSQPSEDEELINGENDNESDESLEDCEGDNDQDSNCQISTGIREPNIENLYKSLSKHTLRMWNSNKDEASELSCKDRHFASINENVSEISQSNLKRDEPKPSHIFSLQMPEPPKLLSRNLLTEVPDANHKENEQKDTEPQLSSVFSSGMPEPPKLLTGHLFKDKITNENYEIKNPKTGTADNDLTEDNQYPDLMFCEIYSSPQLPEMKYKKDALETSKLEPPSMKYKEGDSLEAPTKPQLSVASEPMKDCTNTTEVCKAPNLNEFMGISLPPPPKLFFDSL